MESLDVDKALVQSFVTRVAGIMELNNLYEKEKVVWFAVMQFRKRMIVGSFSGTVIYENVYEDKDLDRR